MRPFAEVHMRKSISSPTFLLTVFLILIPVYASAAEPAQSAGQEQKRVLTARPANAEQPHVYTIEELKQRKLRLQDLKDSDIILSGGRRITVKDFKAEQSQRIANQAKKIIEKAHKDSDIRLAMLKAQEDAKVRSGRTGLQREIASRSAPGNLGAGCSQPRISSVSTISPGQDVTISGCGFLAGAGKVQVTRPAGRENTRGPGGTILPIPVPEQTWDLSVSQWTNTSIVANVPGDIHAQTLFLKVQTAQGTQSAPFNIQVGANTPAPSAQKPKVDSIYPTNITPGDPILITGSHFGNLAGSVFLIWWRGPNGQLRRIEPDCTIQSWTDTEINATIPEITGFPYTVKAAINIIPSQSNDIVGGEVMLSPIYDIVRVAPEQAQEKLSTSADYSNIRETGYGQTCSGHHASNSMISGDDGTDTCYVPALKNNWKIFSINPYRDGFGGEATLTFNPIVRTGETGPVNLTVKWETEASGYIYWELELDIRRPRGIPAF
jgi:hypothetical protein